MQSSTMHFGRGTLGNDTGQRKQYGSDYSGASVAITYEVMHDTRIIPLDGRAHESSEIRRYFGDSRGHWEGDTLVVDVTNFNDKATFRGSGPDMRVTERFTRIDADTLLYQATMHDEATFTRPWTVQVEFKRTSQQFE
jgi:hypothetical protein